MKPPSSETPREFLNELKVEIAEARDIPEILRIADRVRLDPKDPDERKLDKGFLVYTLSSEQYSARLNEYFTVAREGGNVDGFLMCYNRAFLHQLIESGAIAHEDGITEFIQKEESEDDFIFGDQIGIDYTNGRKGVGTKLMKDLFEKMKAKGIKKMYVAVLHEPVKNDVSQSFCQSLGAKVVTEVQNKDGLRWGIYKFEIQKD